MRTTFMILAGLFVTAVASVFAQDEAYTFSSGPFPGDGFTWPSQINDTDTLYAYDSPYGGRMTVYNQINDPVMFGSSYVATGNSSLISGNAMWGNPSSGMPLGDPYLEIELGEFYEFDYDPVLEEEYVAAAPTEVSFDFAWATSAGSPAFPPNISSLEVLIFDYNGDSHQANYVLSGTFNHGLGGSGVGYEGRVTLTTGFGVDDIDYIYIEFDALAPPGSIAEFAIDNMEIYVNGGGGGGGLQEVYPIGNNGTVDPETDYGTNVLKGIGKWGFQGGVYNNSGSAAVFSSTWTSPDPELYDPSVALHTNRSIGPGEIYYPGTEWEIDTDTALSGTYSGSHTVINHSDPSDPDNTFDLVFLDLYDPPALLDNTATTIDPAATNQITLSNAVAGPHVGAKRASVRVQSIAISNPRFTMSGIGLSDRLDAGQDWSGTVAFNSTGLADGVYTATLTMGFEMTTTSNYLNQAQPVPNLVWTLQATVGAPLAPPQMLGLSRSGGTVTITYLSVLGESFVVKGLPNLMDEVDLPNTGMGDGSVKTYTHTPPAGMSRYFYRMVRNP